MMHLCCGLHATCMTCMSNAKDLTLMRWYDEHDIICSRLRIRTPESRPRGVFAAEDIPALEGIAVIPPHMIIRSPFKDMEELVQVITTDLVCRYFSHICLW